MLVKLVALDGVPYVVLRQGLSGPDHLLVRRTPPPARRSTAGRRGVHGPEYPAVRGLGLRGLVLEYSEAVGVGLGAFEFTTKAGDGDRRPEVCE